MSAGDANGTEVWLPYPEMPKFEVSNLGRVRSRVTFSHIGERVKYLMIRDRGTGYRVTTFQGWKDGKKIHFPVRIARVVAQLFVPGYEPGLEVNHKNGNKLDDRAENLEWISPRANVHHAWQLGLMRPGRALLSDQERELMFRCYLDGMPLWRLALAFDLSVVTTYKNLFRWAQRTNRMMPDRKLRRQKKPAQSKEPSP